MIKAIILIGQNFESMKKVSINLIRAVVFLIAGGVIYSCSDENKTLDRDQFIGEYLGEVKCGGAWQSFINSDEQPFSISEKLGGADNEVTIAFESTVPISFDGTVSGRILTIDQMLPDLEVGPDLDGDGNPDPITLHAKGSVTLNSAGNELSGTIDIDGFIKGVSTPVLRGSCPIKASKVK